MNRSKLFFRLKMLNKIAAIDTYAPASIEEANATLNILSELRPPDLNMKLLKEKHKEAVFKNHPDRGGSKEELLKINAAFNFLKKVLDGYKLLFGDAPPSSRYAPPASRYAPPASRYAPPASRYAPPAPPIRLYNIINGLLVAESIGKINQVVVSTIYERKMGLDTWETMVFESENGNIIDYTELDMVTYESESDARSGHIDMCRKWHSKMNSQDPIPDFSY